MKTLLRILLTAFAVLIIARFLNGITVDNYTSAVIVAAVLGLLRVTVKPILVVLTLPVTILTLGLFLFVINAIIVLLADSLISGFSVSGFWVALLFSLLLSLFQSILFSFLKDNKN
jgi:putative membrane protein